MSKAALKKTIRGLEKKIKKLKRKIDNLKKNGKEVTDSIGKQILPFFGGDDEGDVEINISLKRRKATEHDQ